MVDSRQPRLAHKSTNTELLTQTNRRTLPFTQLCQNTNHNDHNNHNINHRDAVITMSSFLYQHFTLFFFFLCDTVSVNCSFIFCLFSLALIGACCLVVRVCTTAFPPTEWPRSQMFSHLPRCCEACAFTVSSRFRVESLRCATPQARRKWATAIFGGGVRAFQNRNSIVLQLGC